MLLINFVLRDKESNAVLVGIWKRYLFCLNCIQKGKGSDLRAEPPCINRGYYTVARRYEFYVLVARTISHSFASLTREILFLPREHKIHIFEPTSNVLFIIWRNQFNKSKRRESWRHWTIRHSQRWHTENTPLESRMKWRMESTSGLVPSKTLFSI